MKLIIVRHGETYENLNKISQGHLNTQLTPKGIEQSNKIAQKLKNENIDIAFSSDLDRALNTCKEILKFHKNTKLIINSELREQKKGILEGKYTTQVRKYIKEHIKNNDYYNWLPPNGEKFSNVWDKSIKFIDELKKEHNNKNILIVSHGGPISCMLAHFHNKTINESREFIPKINTSISIVEINKNKIIFHKTNYSKHLIIN